MLKYVEYNTIHTYLKYGLRFEEKIPQDEISDRYVRERNRSSSAVV